MFTATVSSICQCHLQVEHASAIHGITTSSRSSSGTRLGSLDETRSPSLGTAGKKIMLRRHWVYAQADESWNCELVGQFANDVSWKRRCFGPFFEVSSHVSGPFCLGQWFSPPPSRQDRYAGFRCFFAYAHRSQALHGFVRRMFHFRRV